MDPFEDCDDGNNVDGDGCQANCALPACGDNVVDPAEGEECDDGNDRMCDGCTWFCTVEPVPICGDGIFDEYCEECDDGNNIDGDGCSSDCERTPVVPATSSLANWILVIILFGATAYFLRSRSNAPQ